MVVTNHKLLQLRIGSLLLSAIFAMVVYMDVNEYFMFPLFLLQLVSFLLAFILKRKRKEKSLVSIGRGGTIALIVVYTCAIALGITVSMTASRSLEIMCTLLIYVVILDALMAIPFVLSFTDKSKWQNGGSVSLSGAGSEINPINGRMAAAYADSDYDLMSNEMYWPQSDHHSTAMSVDSLDINPATGQTMMGMYDTSGCLYGYSDPVFTNDNHHTSQFSDFDYHNQS